MKFELRKLVLHDGRCPFDEWFESLEREDQVMVDARLLRVRLGSFGDATHVGGGVSELRFHKGRALRLYFGRSDRNIILLVFGGDKRSQKQDIKKAQKLFATYKLGKFRDENE